MDAQADGPFKIWSARDAGPTQPAHYCLLWHAMMQSKAFTLLAAAMRSISAALSAHMLS